MPYATACAPPPDRPARTRSAPTAVRRRPDRTPPEVPSVRRESA
ncbi:MULTISPECIES: hypothetical protein [unclassified Streptomyces]